MLNHTCACQTTHVAFFEVLSRKNWEPLPRNHDTKKKLCTQQMPELTFGRSFSSEPACSSSRKTLFGRKPAIAACMVHRNMSNVSTHLSMQNNGACAPGVYCTVQSKLDQRASTAALGRFLAESHSRDAWHILDNAKLQSFISGRRAGSESTQLLANLATLQAISRGYAS